ncbi:MAG: F0F1 ATP synthase subunit epsilon [Armatimonadota bacterium]
MNLRVVTPSRTIVDARAVRVSVRGADGARTYLPRHIDFVTAVLPSVMSWFTPDGEEHFAAID